MKNKRFLMFPSSIAASFILLAPALHADAITWVAGGGDNNWATPLNWSDNGSPAGDDVTFNATGAVASGTTNTVSTSETINSLSYSFEDADNQHTTAIAADQTLAVSGSFLLTGSATATTATNVTITGATETLTVGNGVDSSFQVGQTTPTSGTTATNLLDMSGLGILTANLGASGIFRMGAASVATAGPLTTVRLAATSTLTADVLGVGDRAGRGGLHTLKLGSTENAINANNLNVGPTGSGGRGNGDLSFDTSGGTLTLRAADGISAVTAMNLINNSFGTANNQTGTANFAGHDVDAQIATLTMGRRNSTGTAASGTATLTFDTGTLEVDTANLGVNAQASSTSGTINATINIGGGSASFNAINMATSIGGAATTTTALLNLTGGTTTVNGDIIKGGGTGTTTATVTLNGGTLDMTAGNIGSSTQTVALLLQSGTLQNVAQVNGSGGITKINDGNPGGGSLTLAGTNAFTGDINISTGEVKITESGNVGTGPKNIQAQANGYLTLDGTGGAIVLPADITMSTAGLSLLNLAGDNVINGAISVITGNATTTVTSDSGSLTLAGAIAPGASVASARTLQLAGTSTGANTVSGAITDGALTLINLRKSGAGTWSLTSASNTYSGNTTVEEGILSVSTPNFDDDSTVSIGTLATPGVAFLNLPNAGDDTVATLSIDGVEQPGGKTYGNASSVLPIIATTAITGPGTITVPAGPATPYTLWADTFLPGNDVSNPDGDNDNDGLVNQQEFAFGLSPIDGSSVNPILVQLDKSAGTFTYQRRAGTGLTYRILTSTTLEANSWMEDAAATLGEIATPSGSNENVVITLTGPLAATKLFVRVAAD